MTQIDFSAQKTLRLQAIRTWAPVMLKKLNVTSSAKKDLIAERISYAQIRCRAAAHDARRLKWPSIFVAYEHYRGNIFSRSLCSCDKKNTVAKVKEKLI